MKKWYYSLIIIFFLANCGGNQNTIDDKAKEVEKNVTANPGISKETLSEIIQSIPSPLEVSFLIKDMGIKYDKELLNPTENTSKYNTAYYKALNLGTYSADLGYANIYGQNQDALNFLSSVRDMADGLKIGQFFDFKTIQKLATNSNNLDSLLLVTTTNLEQINTHLQKQGRSDMTILILTGGWLEALHLTCKVAARSNIPALNERIAEQKVILEQLLLLLSYYKSDPKIAELEKQLTGLQKTYETIKVTYVQDTTQKTKVENGVVMAQDNTKTQIEFTKKDLENILNTTTAIRSEIINPK